MSGNQSKSAFFEEGWVTLSADFGGKGASPTNHCWYQSSRLIALSCGIKISAVRHLVLSQCTRVTDRQTDGRTELRLPRPVKILRLLGKLKNGS